MRISSHSINRKSRKQIKTYVFNRILSSSIRRRRRRSRTLERIVKAKCTSCMINFCPHVRLYRSERQICDMGMIWTVSGGIGTLVGLHCENDRYCLLEKKTIVRNVESDKSMTLLDSTEIWPIWHTDQVQWITVIRWKRSRAFEYVRTKVSRMIQIVTVY